MALKVADTVVFAFKVTLQAAVPVHPPVHPSNVDADPCVSVRVTTVPAANEAWHVEPQLMPAGVLAMVPVPLPEPWTVSWYRIGAAVKVADTVVFPFIVTLQAPVPLHPPAQPPNVEVDPGVPVSVTTVPAVNVATQVEPQLMPDGVLVMVPPPLPELCTVSWYEGVEAEPPPEPPEPPEPEPLVIELQPGRNDSTPRQVKINRIFRIAGGISPRVCGAGPKLPRQV